MKKYTILLMVGILIITLGSCGQKKKQQSKASVFTVSNVMAAEKKVPMRPPSKQVKKDEPGAVEGCFNPTLLADLDGVVSDYTPLKKWCKQKDERNTTKCYILQFGARVNGNFRYKNNRKFLIYDLQGLFWVRFTFFGEFRKESENVWFNPRTWRLMTLTAIRNVVKYWKEMKIKKIDLEELTKNINVFTMLLGQRKCLPVSIVKAFESGMVILRQIKEKLEKHIQSSSKEEMMGMAPKHTRR